ncbi:hypothetical protein [uncultured Paraglaciecola sp.]|uniref:hypothetical protein n=1 Tax=uncultured Paraglaciecola sp. TaxID=1765024 RepID=UPI0026348175|nr:hypothetical protein [uncultured Paraglaciecola sp.]
MLSNTKIAVIALASSFIFASSVQAKEVSLETYVTGMVNQAMDVAQQEINNNLRSAVLTVANNVSFNEEKSYAAKVSITDIKMDSEEATNTQAE